MKFLYLRDVGDGLNLHIKNDTNHNLTVDFGGNKRLHCPFRLHGSFLLSHFHTDHYNGILSCYNRHFPFKFWNLSNFYYPAMPVFLESKELYKMFIAMNIRISNNHPIQSTIMEYISSLNQNKISFHSVSRGDIITCGNTKYEILWPPKVLKEEETLKSIKNAIRDFNKALDGDTELSSIYERIKNKFSDRDFNEINIEESNENSELTDFTGKLSELTKKANSSLKSAANRLSIAFRQDDNLLFLGDLEKRELKSVVANLVNEKNTVYDVIIAAHHGTHWDDELLKLKCNICLASLGSKLNKYLKNEYKIISEKLIRTDDWGDINIKKEFSIK